MSRVVLAEDDETMVQLLSTLLRMDGFEVQAVGREEDVASAVSRLQPDALILDMLLFNQNGLDVLDRIRSNDGGSELCVIMISGLNVREECMRHGADDFLMKPFMPEDLSNVLRRHLRTSTPEILIRELRFPDDYADTIQLWESIEKGIRVGPSDTPAEIKKKLERDPDLFLIAEFEGRLVGTVIGGFDGRRGFVYHLAVVPWLRRRGVGRRLMDEVERRLRLKGCLRCYLLVRPENMDAMGYYEKTGWSLLDDAVFAKDLV